MYIPILYKNGYPEKALIGLDMSTAKYNVDLLNKAIRGLSDDNYTVEEKYTDKSDREIIEFLGINS